MKKKRIVDVLLVLGIVLAGGIILVKMVPGDVFVPESPFETKQEFFEAIEKGAVEKVEQALASGEFKPGIKNDKEYTALMYAIRKSRPRVVRVLIDNGADYKTPQKSFYLDREINYEAGKVNSTDVQFPLHPLTEAARLGHLEIVKILLEAGAEPNALITLGKIKKFSNQVYELILSDLSKKEAKIRCVYSPLLFASEKGYPGVAKTLLEAGADPHIKGPGYHTPLHKAARSGHVEVLKKLLRYGGNVDIYTENGSTPLGLAALHGQTKVVKFLVKNGAKINREFDFQPPTPLANACYYCSSEVVEYLLSKGAKPKQIGKTQYSLLYAVDLASITERPKKREECMRVIKMLLEAGADPTLKSDEGKTAFDYATDEDIKQLLQKYSDNREGTQN
jgi:ankyrin repeat protein